MRAIALFSGGLDSILAAKVVMEQGVEVRCLHFTTPFFGKPDELAHWREIYGLDIEAVDVGDDFVRMLRQRPQYGFGKIMNPCVDCKILMMRHARQRMAELEAGFLISGEVLGQRPMSQRRDTLNVILRDGGVRNILLRPLCAQHLDPTEPELTGVLDRSRLLGMSGRGRSEQLALAAAMNIAEIPTPGGGCRLAEKENARRYWPVLTRVPDPVAADFDLANVGRQGWSANLWLSMGRNEADNESLPRLARSGDVLMKVLDYPGPLALLRPVGEPSPEEWRLAAALLASFAVKAVRAGGEVQVRLSEADGSTREILTVLPERHTAFDSPEFDDIRDAIHGK